MVAVAGVIGDGGRAWAELIPLSCWDAFGKLSGSSGGSLLGAGVRLLLGPLVADPLAVGKPSRALAGVLNGFFWKKPIIVFWFLLDCELDDFLRLGGWLDGVLWVGPAIMNNDCVQTTVSGRVKQCVGVDGVMQWVGGREKCWERRDGRRVATLVSIWLHYH